MRWLVYFTLSIVVHSYRPVILIPGLGGSIIRDQQKTIWPPSINKVLFAPGSGLETRYDIEKERFMTLHENQTVSDVISIYSFLQYYLKYTKVLPYDCRLLGNVDYIFDIYSGLKHMIEKEVQEQNNKCTIIGHSLGGQITHDFLIHNSPEWRKKYIRRVISINTPYGGSLNSLKVLKNKQVLNPLTLRHIDMAFIRYIGGVLWTLPNRFHLPDKIIYKDGDMEYTGKDIEHVLKIIDVPETFDLYHRYFDRRLMDIGKDTGIDLHVLYSRGLRTLSYLNKDGTEEYEDGDDTVCADSLLLPQKWGRKNVIVKEFEGSHLTTLFNIKVLSYIYEVIKEDKSLSGIEK
jgi:lysophospholipase III